MAQSNQSISFKENIVNGIGIGFGLGVIMALVALTSLVIREFSITTTPIPFEVSATDAIQYRANHTTNFPLRSMGYHINHTQYIAIGRIDWLPIGSTEAIRVYHGLLTADPASQKLLLFYVLNAAGDEQSDGTTSSSDDEVLIARIIYYPDCPEFCDRITSLPPPP